MPGHPQIHLSHFNSLRSFPGVYAQYQARCTELTESGMSRREAETQAFEEFPRPPWEATDANWATEEIGASQENPT